MEAVILAGGFGTRLQPVVKNIPKPMAEINGRPFLAYLLDFLTTQNIETVILSVGYKNEVIQEYFGNNYKDINIKYSIEGSPLGTGGAIKKSLSLIKQDNCFVMNGDTLFKADLSQLCTCHKTNLADLTMSLKPMKDFDRYGTVSLNDTNRITGFEEKQYKQSGLINGGIYLIKSDLLKNCDLPEKFSFEKDFIEKYYTKLKFYGVISNNYFIDIGIPEDYKKAQKFLLEK